MGYKFTESDRMKSNAKSISDAIERFFQKGTHPSNAWFRKIYREHFKVEYKCNECGITDWNGKDIILEIDHINGDNTDNRIENLRYLCPNCHSQTSTYKGRNINSGFELVSDEELLEAYNSEGNIRKALIKVGLAPKGGNYNRMYRVLNKNNKP
jgi:Zn finger protein HypA/HybF involved in hydrogenase expression